MFPFLFFGLIFSPFLILIWTLSQRRRATMSTNSPNAFQCQHNSKPQKPLCFCAMDARKTNNILTRSCNLRAFLKFTIQARSQSDFYFIWNETNKKKYWNNATLCRTFLGISVFLTNLFKFKNMPSPCNLDFKLYEVHFHDFCLLIF